jgi:hypothetical protein
MYIASATGDRAEVDALEQVLHVLKRGDGDAALAHFAQGARVVGVIPHERRHVEGDRETGLSLREQEFVAFIRLLGGAEARELTHRP